MTFTRVAEAYVNVTAKYYSPQFWSLILNRAEEIAGGRGATRLGRMHIEMALDEVICSECDSVIYDRAEEHPDGRPLCGDCYGRLYGQRDAEDAIWAWADASFDQLREDGR